MKEHYAVRRYRERNQSICAARLAGATIAELMVRFDLSQARIYHILKHS